MATSQQGTNTSIAMGSVKSAHFTCCSPNRCHRARHSDRRLQAGADTRQAPYADFPQGLGGLPVSEAKADVHLALAMHPYLAEEVQDQIIEAVRGFND